MCAVLVSEEEEDPIIIEESKSGHHIEEELMKGFHIDLTRESIGIFLLQEKIKSDQIRSDQIVYYSSLRVERFHILTI